MSVHLRDLRVCAGERALVDVADLRLERGRAVTIVGESGSGKSLLAHALMGTLAADLTVRGRMTFGADTYDLAERRTRVHLWGKVMALLPQEPVLALDPTMRVRDQVAEGAAEFLRDRRAARARATSLLGGLGLAQAERSHPHTLSGGMAQRVAFAAATIGQAPILVCDEPSKGLDDAARAGLAALLTRHLEQGSFLLTITHDLDLARQLGGEVLVMKEATVVEDGPADVVLDRPHHPYTRRLLAAEPRRWTHPWLASGATAGGTSPTDAPSLVQGQGLSKAYGDHVLFSDLSVSVGPHERIALVGPSGAGKTTLGNVLLRLAPADRGHVEHSPALRGGRLQKLYQDPAVSFPRHVPLRQSLHDVLRRHRLPASTLESLLGSLRLPAQLLNRTPGHVSGGELQRLAIIRALLLQPLLIFADEPTSRLDLITQEETVACLMEHVTATGCALMLVTHDESLATALTHRRIVLGERPVPAAVVPDLR